MKAYGFDLNKTLVTMDYLDFVRSVDTNTCDQWLAGEEDSAKRDQDVVDRFEQIIEDGLISKEMNVTAIPHAVETLGVLENEGRIFVYSTCSPKATAGALEQAGITNAEPLSTYDYQKGRTDIKTVAGLQAVKTHLGVPVLSYTDDKLRDLRSARTVFGPGTRLYHFQGEADDQEAETIAIPSLDQILRLEQGRF